MKNYKAKKHKTVKKDLARLPVWVVEFDKVLTIKLPPSSKTFKAATKKEAIKKANEYVKDEQKREKTRNTPVIDITVLKGQLDWLWKCGRFFGKVDIKKEKHIKLTSVKKTDNYGRSEYGYTIPMVEYDEVRDFVKKTLDKSLKRIEDSCEHLHEEGERYCDTCDQTGQGRAIDWDEKRRAWTKAWRRYASKDDLNDTAWKRHDWTNLDDTPPTQQEKMRKWMDEIYSRNVKKKTHWANARLPNGKKVFDDSWYYSKGKRKQFMDWDDFFRRNRIAKDGRLYKPKKSKRRKDET